MHTKLHDSRSSSLRSKEKRKEHMGDEGPGNISIAFGARLAIIVLSLSLFLLSRFVRERCADALCVFLYTI